MSSSGLGCFPPEGYTFLESRIIGIGISIAIRPNGQKFIGFVIRDTILNLPLVQMAKNSLVLSLEIQF